MSLTAKEFMQLSKALCHATIGNSNMGALITLDTVLDLLKDFTDATVQIEKTANGGYQFSARGRESTPTPTPDPAPPIHK